MIIFGSGKLINVALEQIIPDEQIVIEQSVEVPVVVEGEDPRPVPDKIVYDRNNTRRDVRDGIALLIVGVPVFIGHGLIARKKKKE